MTAEVVWGVRRQLVDLARYVDHPLHATMLAEVREALDAWLALLVAETPVYGSDIDDAKDAVFGALFALGWLVDFPQASEVAAWGDVLAQVGRADVVREAPREQAPR